MLDEPFTDRREAIALFELLRGRDPKKSWPLLPILTFLAPGGGGKSTLIEYLRAKQCYLSTGRPALPYAHLDFTPTRTDTPKDLLEILVELRNRLQLLDDGQGRNLTFPRFDLGAAIALAAPREGGLPQLSQDKIVPSLTAALPFFQSIGEMGNALGNIVPFIPPILVGLKWVAQIPPLRAILQIWKSGPGWKWYRTHSVDVGLLAEASIEDVLRRLYALSMRWQPGRDHLIKHLLPAAFLEDLRDALDRSQSAWSRTANVVLFLDSFEELLKDKDPNNTGIQLLEMLTEHRKHKETADSSLLIIIGSRQHLFQFDQDSQFQQLSASQYEFIAEKYAEELAQAEQRARKRVRELYERWQYKQLPKDRRFLRLEHLYLPLWLQDFEPIYTCNYLLDFGKQEQMGAFAPIDSTLVQTINDVTHGHPLCLALVAAAMMEAQASGRPLMLDEFPKIQVPSYPPEIAEGHQNELIKDYLLPLFLRQLSEPEQKDLIFCAAPRTLDIDTLQAVLPHLDDIEVRKRWERYCRFTFVSVIDNKRIVLHPIVHDLLLQQLSPSSEPTSTYQQVHTRLLEHFSRRSKKDDKQAQIEEAYHALALGNPGPAISLALSVVQSEPSTWKLLLEAVTEAPAGLIPPNTKRRASDALHWAMQHHDIPNVVTAIVLYRWLLKVPRRDTLETAGLWHHLGLAYSMLPSRDWRANLKLAVACYDAALAAFTNEITPDRARIQNNKGNALRNLAKLLWDSERIARLGDAITCYDDAIMIYTHKIDPANLAITLHNKGMALHDSSESMLGTERRETLNKALACYNTALQKRDLKAVRIDWATIQNCKCKALCEIAKLAEKTEGVKVLQEAASCCDDVLTLIQEKDPVKWAVVQHNKGNALRDFAKLLPGSEIKAKLREAVACYDKALLELGRRREEASTEWAMTLRDKGSTLNDLGRMLTGIERTETLRAAITCYVDILTGRTEDMLSVDYYRDVRSAGMLLFEIGDWVQAAHYLSTALNVLDELFTLEVTARGHQATLAAVSDLSIDLAYALIRTEETDAILRAAEVLERGRTRVIGEAIALQEAQLVAAKQLEPDLLTTFREACNRLVPLILTDNDTLGASTYIVDATGARGDTQEMSVAQELSDMMTRNTQLAERMALNTVVARIREKIPNFLYPGQVFELATEVLEPDERLAYVASTSAGAVAIVVGSPSAETAMPTAVGWCDERLTNAQIARLLGDFTKEDREQQKKGSGGLLAAQNNMGNLSKALSVTMQTLGASDGVLTHLTSYCRTAGIRHLVQVPCGLLSLLPLHAALVPAATEGEEPEPLLDVVRVSYAPSARIWTACRRRVKAYSVEKPSALVIGDPQPQEPEAHLLPGARDEALSISRIITQGAHGQVTTFLGEAATLLDVSAILRAQGSTLTHAHFACHGQAELTDPQTSGLLLAYGARLTTRDLLDPTMIRFERLRLVVLSAGQTALPGTNLPDEAIGLPSAWLQAGTAGVLASLWRVSDRATVALMTKFYELHLLDRLDPVEALWLAQRWLRGLPTWRADCKAAGAVHTADGPEVGEVEMMVRGTAGMTADDTPKDNSKGGIAGTTSKSEHWKHPRYWAAFAIYGA